MAKHEQAVGKTAEWYTPPHVFEALGCRFDVDVASPGPERTPWIPADRFYTASHDGLKQPWKGFVWMNPPFNDKEAGIIRNGVVPWLEKFFDHGNGIALTPDRTSAPWWQQFAPRANSILFATPKIRFIDVNGNPGRSPAQGTCLMACGYQAILALQIAAARNLGVLLVPTAPQ